MNQTQMTHWKTFMHPKVNNLKQKSFNLKIIIPPKVIRKKLLIMKRVMSRHQ